MGGLGNDNQFFEEALFLAFGRHIPIRGFQFASGGCINNAVRLQTAEGDFFIKWNEDAQLENMFAIEAKGLSLLRAASPLFVPEVLGTGKASEKHFLLLEYVDSHRKSGDYWEQLGQGLAEQHQKVSPGYGLDHSNYIGRLVQKNGVLPSWIEFFIAHRLKVQAGLAFYNGLVHQSFMDRMEKLYEQLPMLLVDGPASLLHGDLWSGNIMSNAQGLPTLIDPAVYYGHREIELAFTQLFGGFEARFYAAYHEAYPLEPGFEDRAAIYNLYPLLVHANLFGHSYLSGVEQVLHHHGI